MVESRLSTKFGDGKSGRERTEFKTKLLAYAGADVAYTKLVSRGANPERLLDGLQLSIGIRKPPHDWFSLPGIPRHKLRRLPTRIRNWRNHLDQVNDDFQADCFFRFVLTIICANKLGHQLQSLVDGTPEHLELCAMYIDFVGRISGKIARTASRSFREMQLLLVHYVHQSTGKYYYEDVATLITGAHHAIGNDFVVEPMSLQKRYSRSWFKSSPNMMAIPVSIMPSPVVAPKR
jgi:hypothetical protein